MTPDRSDTERFLKALDPKSDAFTFQTFDDKPKRHDKSLVCVLNGTLDQHWDSLCNLNERGAGIYVTVNETDLKGRTAKNITRVRAVFADLDGAPLEPATKHPVPHIIVESSPARWHTYWLVEGMPLDAKVFRNAQKQIIKRLDSDPKITDLPRVLRLPGFIHQKAKPFRVRVASVSIRNGPYNAKQFITTEEPEEKPSAAPSGNADPKEIDTALKHISSDDYQIWFEVGCALSEELGDEGFEIFDAWSKKSSKYDESACERKWDECRKVHKFTAGTIYHYASKANPRWRGSKPLKLEDFVAYMPMHNYIYMPNREPWPASSVDARLKSPIKKMQAHTWLDKNNPVEQMIWAPGLPAIIENRLMNEGGWIDKEGARSLNLYIPPDVAKGDARKVQPWLDHVSKIYPKDSNHIIKWLAHRVQFPQEKINHALVLGGAQGIGKDTILAPVKYAVGNWNFRDITPKDILGRFNEFIKGVILRISEARDLGEINRYQFYEHTKVYTASPPEVLRCDAKNLREHAVLNVCGVIITTNYKTNGIYLPADDRRHYVAWSAYEKEQFVNAYWNKIWKWYEGDGCANVAAYLLQLDTSDFDAKAPPPKTEAFMAIVDASRAPEESEFSDILDAMGNPDVVTIEMLAQEANKPPTHSMDFYNFLTDRKNRRMIPHRMEEAGYEPIRNPESQQGLWVIGGKRQSIYAKQTLTIKEQLMAARKLMH